MTEERAIKINSVDSSERRIAHFLLTPNLEKSPPNDALTRIYHQLGMALDMFAPLSAGEASTDGANGVGNVSYGYRWLILNLFKPRWSRYHAFSCTSEDPIVVAALLAFIWRKPLIFLSDEIKSGAYRGNRSNFWKKLCRWSMRQASLTIVNDQSRVGLQQRYAELDQEHQLIVYPGCFVEPPKADNREVTREHWETPDGYSVLCFSGACNLSAGIDWALEALDHHTNVQMVTQPLTVEGLNRYLLQNHRNADRIHVQQTRMSWQESWSSMGGVDVGIAIYTNPADQFQLMGISSNRLCMFLAMGVPVIVNKQASFQFVEDYDCGVMVENAEEFSAALERILANNQQMKENALRCSREYIDAAGKYDLLLESIRHTVDD